MEWVAERKVRLCSFLKIILSASSTVHFFFFLSQQLPSSEGCPESGWEGGL